MANSFVLLVERLLTPDRLEQIANHSGETELAVVASFWEVAVHANRTVGVLLGYSCGIYIVQPEAVIADGQS
jgi:hypothetical protein